MDIGSERMVLSLLRVISDRKEWARVQRPMTRELLHGVKNSVAVIQSLVSLTAPPRRLRAQGINAGQLTASAAGAMTVS